MLRTVMLVLSITATSTAFAAARGRCWPRRKQT